MKRGDDTSFANSVFTDSRLNPEDVTDVGGPSSKPLGAILAETRGLTAAQIEQVLAYQQEHDLRFGEAATALGFVTADDVLYALAQQFNYPYAPEHKRSINPELVTLNEPFSRQAEAFRAVRSQVMMRVWSADAPAGKGTARALAVISPESGDGKTFFAANLAVTLAQLGGRTILVDADMRGPRQHEVFHLSNSVGLSGILAGRADRHAVQRVTGVPSLYVLPVGVTPPNPLELAERPIFAQLLRELCTRFDHVVVDTPAHQYGADGPVIASRCGAALIIARRHSSKLSALQHLLRTFGGGSTQVAGVIVNEFQG